MRELKQQLLSGLLVIITVAAVVAAAINLQQQSRFHLPDDGITWEDHPQADGSTQVVAVHVAAGSPGQKAGVRAGDVLVAIRDRKIDSAATATQALATLREWTEATYTCVRDGKPYEPKVIIGEAERNSALFYQYAVGAIYLAIGLFVYFRRGNAPRALHFFLMCVARFIFSTFHYTGKLNNFDKVIYLGNVVAGYVAPTLFLHFCCVFPEPQKWIRRKCAAMLVHLPGIALLVMHSGFIFGWLRSAAPLIEVRWLLDRTWLVFFCSMYAAGGG